jgi:hypothetical protein
MSCAGVKAYGKAVEGYGGSVCVVYDLTVGVLFDLIFLPGIGGSVVNTLFYVVWCSDSFFPNTIQVGLFFFVSPTSVALISRIGMPIGIRYTA